MMQFIRNTYRKTKECVKAGYKKAVAYVGVAVVGVVSVVAPTTTYAVPPTPATITTDLQGVLTSAQDIFTAIVPIVIGVCALGILIYMIKLVRNRG